MVIKIVAPKPKPEEVFTPRGEFNPKMYTPRAVLESDFAQKLRQHSHLILFGDSGCGKSWLYRSFFAQNGVQFKVVNLADASRNGRIGPEILRTVMGSTPQLKGYDEKKQAQGGVPVVANVTFDHTNKFDVPAEDPIRQSISAFRKQAGPGKVFLVFDNLERIFDKPALMEELADIITLADDPDFLKHQVRFLLVGVPAGIREYFSKTPSHRTVANRLVELLEVSRLTPVETRALVRRGFTEVLGYNLTEPEAIVEHVEWVSTRIPQAVHEYCLELAFLSEQGREVKGATLETADEKWLRGSLNSTYSIIDGQLNERDTKIQRRNQVLYVLGRMDSDDFKLAQVEAKVRAHFYPNEPAAAVGGIANALGELADASRGAILRRTPKGDAYMFIDPQYRMCIRAMLRIGANNAVEKVSFEELS